MGVNKVSVSRWESGGQRIGKESDRLLRLVCFAKIVEIASGSSEAADGLIQAARKVRSMNLASLLKQIENAVRGEKKVRINPAEMAAYQTRPELPQSRVVQ